jgi:hypothetical protein
MAAEGKATRPPRRAAAGRRRRPDKEAGWSVEFEIDNALRVTDTEVERSEIAAIKRRWRAGIHQKDLALTDHVTVLPERKRASAVILFMRDAHLASIDRNKGTDTTYCLPVQGENGLEQRHAAREIASLRGPSGARLRRIGNGERGEGQTVRRVHAVEPDRDACGDVPDEARGHSSVRRDGGNGHRHSPEHNETACHRITRLRRSQA